VTERGNDLALVEAALFLSSQPMTRRALAKLLGDVRLAYVDGLLEDLATAYEDPARGIQVHVEEGRALLRVKNDYVNRVAHLAPQQDVPRPVLRTLAVIAYNHPMTQADLVRVRGNKAYGHVQELIERELIVTEPQGRTILLKITPEFLRHFGLKTVEEFRFHAASPELEIPPPDAADSETGESAEEPGSIEVPTPEAEPADEEDVSETPDVNFPETSSDGVPEDSDPLEDAADAAEEDSAPEASGDTDEGKHTVDQEPGDETDEDKLDVEASSETFEEGSPDEVETIEEGADESDAEEDDEPLED